MCVDEPVQYIHSCVCVCVCVAMLPSLVLHRTSVRPYQRGLYCGDSSLSYPYKKSTVPSSVLSAVGLTLPTVSVSLAHVQGARMLGNAEGRNRWRAGGGHGGGKATGKLM